jgi:hypothetical protein
MLYVVKKNKNCLSCIAWCMLEIRMLLIMHYIVLLSDFLFKAYSNSYNLYVYSAKLYKIKS